MTLGPGVRRLRDDPRRGPRTAHRDRVAALRDQHGRDRDRHRHHRRSRATRAAVRVTSRRSPGSPSRRRPTSSRPRATPARSCRSRASLKRNAVKLSKICNDLRLLSSGPQAGFGEINLPPRQAGSSIMPGKVNPVIPEVVNQVAFAVVGADVTVTMAAEGGPAAAQRLRAGHRARSAAVDHLDAPGVRDAARQLRRRHRPRTASASPRSVAPQRRRRHRPHAVHRLRRAAEIARTALAGGSDVRDLVLGSGAMEAAELDELLRPERLTEVLGSGA